MGMTMYKVVGGFAVCDSSLSMEEREQMKYTVTAICSSRKHPSD